MVVWTGNFYFSSAELHFWYTPPSWVSLATACSSRDYIRDFAIFDDFYAEILYFRSPFSFRKNRFSGKSKMKNQDFFIKF